MTKYRLSTPEEHYAFKQLKLVGWYGVDAVELADGNFVYPDRVYPDIINLIDRGEVTKYIKEESITEYELEEYKLKVKYLDGDDEEHEIEIEWDNKNQFPEIEDPKFREYNL